jgi:hypothetical protein
MVAPNEPVAYHSADRRCPGYLPPLDTAEEAANHGGAERAKAMQG